MSEWADTQSSEKCRQEGLGDKTGRPICPEIADWKPRLMGTGGKQTNSSRVKVEIPACRLGWADETAPIPEHDIGLSDHRPTGAVEEAVLCCCWGLWGRGALSEHLPHPLVRPDMLSTLQFWTPKPSTARNRAGTPHIPGWNKRILCCLNITSEPPPQACGAGVRPEGDGAKWK